MTANEMLPETVERKPVVFMRPNGVFASSRDVAEFFGKQHKNVLRDIDELIASAPELAKPSAEGGMPNFEQGYYTLPSTGDQQHRCYEMDRTGFTLIAMGFTGAAALGWKIKYIAAFDAMEEQLRNPETQMLLALRDPAQVRGMLLHFTEKVLSLESHVAEMLPKVEALGRIAESEGSFCITDAAKTLQVQPKSLFSFLRSHRWIYSRPGGSSEVAYQDKLAQGLLEHKTTTVHRSDGSEKVITQVRVTPKGLTRLAQEFPPVANVA